MLTFHSIVRGFEGEFDRIQRNAIKSWLMLGAEVLLFGDDEPGAVEAGEGLGLPVYPLERNHRGIPTVRWPIAEARRLATYDTRCLVNADVILTSDFAWCVRACQRTLDEFLLVTQRWGLKVDREIDFSDRNWDVNLLMELKRRGHAKHRKAVDYFCYRGDWLRDVPAFAVGRTSWDNWIVWKALEEGVPVVDATPVSVCVHQEHAKRRISAETNENRAIFVDAVGAEEFEGMHVCGLDDATHYLTDRGVIGK
jgi:hypothetical protein